MEILRPKMCPDFPGRPVMCTPASNRRPALCDTCDCNELLVTFSGISPCLACVSYFSSLPDFFRSYRYLAFDPNISVVVQRISDCVFRAVNVLTIQDMSWTAAGCSTCDPRVIETCPDIFDLFHSVVVTLGVNAVSVWMCADTQDGTHCDVNIEPALFKGDLFPASGPVACQDVHVVPNQFAVCAGLPGGHAAVGGIATVEPWS